MIPYGTQYVDSDDVERVKEVLNADFLTQGPVVPQFEDALALKVGADFAIAMSSATAALHVACMALGVRKGDKVWTTPISFVATANAATYCGADVDFVDVDNRTFNMSVDELERKLEAAKKTNETLPKVVITVHLGGLPTDQERIWNLSKKFGFRVIEDASHALGASYKGHPVGSCAYSDITVFSFHPVKIITTAEGGVATTNSTQLAQSMASLRSHGIQRDGANFLEPSHGDWYYEMQELGWNYRMNEMQAALGLSQLSKLDKFLASRRDIRSHYLESKTLTPLDFQEHPEGSVSANHLMIVQVPKKTRKSTFDNLRASGIGVNVHYIPIPFHPYYSKAGTDTIPNALEYYSKAISLPIYPELTREQVDLILKETRPRPGYQAIF